MMVRQVVRRGSRNLHPASFMRIILRSIHFVITACACGATAASAQSRAQSEGVTITFLANEGVMLSSGTRKVLIDALFLKYGPGYAVPADSTQRALHNARLPFDQVDLILVTHRHGDHFHPVPAAAHLRMNPRAHLVTSQQVIDSLRAGASGLPDARILSRTTPPGLVRREVVDGITVHLLGLPHGGERHRQVEHLGYMVELGGRRVLHVGDTDISEAAFAPLRLDTARIDVALLPAWMVTSRAGRQVIERWIRPRQVIAIHVGDGEESRTSREVQAAMPTAITFARRLESRRF